MTVVEPLRLLCHSSYQCDSRFHTELLRAQLCDDTRYGFIVTDGSCSSFHVLTGDSKETIFKKEVNLPKKHGRGGQSQNRFARIREEKRDWYTTEMSEAATKHFIDSQTCKPNVSSLIIAGSGHLKETLVKKLDPRLSKIILRTYDVQYSGEAGFNEVLRLAEDDLVDSRYAHQARVLNSLFHQISSDGLYSVCVADSIWALENGVVDTLIVWEDLPTVRVEFVHNTKDDVKVVYADSMGALPDSPGDEWSIGSCECLVDWLLERHKDFGSNIEIVGNKTALGAQFASGFGGVGASLRYKIELPSAGQLDDSDEYEYDY